MTTAYQFLSAWVTAHIDDDRGASLVEYALLVALIAVEARHLELFRSKIFSDLSNPEFEMRRSEIMLPLFKIYWCCRVLEDSLSDSTSQVGPIEAQSKAIPWLSMVAAARRILNGGGATTFDQTAGDRQ